jgi:hypothetical protein
MTAHDCASCTNACCNLRGTTTCPDKPAGVTPNDSIIDELREEHAIMSVTLPCPCTTDANSATPGNPKPYCEFCKGTGKIEYGINEVEFF